MSALSVVEHLYRLLVIKYSAYFGSASPVFPKKGQPQTTELLEGDERLRREWENVLVRRTEFCEHSNPMCLDASCRRPAHRDINVWVDTHG